MITVEPPKKGKKQLEGTAAHRGPIRNALESFGMAVLMAVLLKYFVLEAYVIPTPSMQPTLMGSPKEGESDRILVDKLYYLLHEPKRWDIVVFRYPVRQVQSYVKRIVGMGGDRLKIAGGNLYNIVGGKLQILRKPERVQRTLWREIYPMRRRLALYRKDEDPWQIPPTEDVIGRNGHFTVRFGGWSIDSDGAWIGKPRSNLKLGLAYKSRRARNTYSDGYDLSIAAQYDEREEEAVHDLRIGFDLTPANTPDKVEVVIDVTSLGLRFGLEVKGGKGVLYANRMKPEPAKSQSREIGAFEIPAGETTSIRFARLDDALIAWRNGDEVGRFELGDDFAILQDLDVDNVVPRFAVHGEGKSKFENVKIERDLHYTRSYLAKDKIIEVPEGHFFMMGDNTLGSADGRDWTAIKIGVDKDGNIVDPRHHTDAKVYWGNKRPKRFEGHGPPHDDDNPVPMKYRDRVLFIDQMGEIRSLYGKIDPKAWANDDRPGYQRVQFLATPPMQPWIPEEKPASFVPRKHIQGRPIARFLRAVSSLKFTSWIR